jgi:hypothetical protein
MKFICRLLSVARYHHKEVRIDLDGWVARPLTLSSYFYFISSPSISCFYTDQSSADQWL